MARILYSLSGQGRGHTSRVLAVSDELRRRGHDIHFCCGDPAASALLRDGYPVLRIPAPAERVRNNRVRIVASAWRNAPLAFRTPYIVEALAERMRALDPDLVVSDFEPFAPRAARTLGIPCVALDHQHILTETRCRVPLRFAASAALTRLGVSVIAPRRLFERIVVPSFFFPTHRAGSDVRLIPPVLRRDVLHATPTQGDHVLVYVNHPEGAERLLDTLRAVDARFVVYNIPAPSDTTSYPNIAFRSASRAGFVDDLAACRAVVCTAGFTLLSEALWLGKPVLALPNRGFFEQTLNALYLRDVGGEAVFGPLRPDRLTRFLDRTPQPIRAGGVGNAIAAEQVEAALPRPVFALAS